MAAFERAGPLKLEPQLDGSASQSFDCGVAACVMALDDASYGLIRPSTEAVRKRMGGDRDATNPDQWKVAIDSFADRFISFGLQPPKTAVVRGKGHDELWRLLHDQRRRVIAALHYGTVAREKRALWASRSFRGNHAVYLRAAKVVDEGRRVAAYDPLADGRFEGCPNGRRPWPFWLVRAATGNIEREREEASQRLARTRDVAAWQATMARLDAEQQVARQPRQQQRMAPEEVVAYLRSLPSLWNDAGPEGRQALASALFTKLEVEGYTKMRYALTPDAVTLGLGAALPAQTETGGHTGGFGRGERGSASLTHLRFRPRFVLENVTAAVRSWPAAYRKVS